MKLTLEAIKIIDTIAKSGSFTKASEILHKAPSTISYSVSKIEEQMGIQFFERNGPHVTLTAMGGTLLEEGRILLSAVADLEERLQKMAKGVERSITIVIDAIFPMAVFYPLLEKFKQSGVSTEVNLIRETLMGSWEALLKFRADLVIAAGEGPSGGGYSTYPIGMIPFTFCISPNHPLAKIDRILTKQDLLEYPAIVLADSARYLPTHSVSLFEGQKRITVNTLEDKIQLQVAGMGHGFLPKHVVKHYIRTGALIEKSVQELQKEASIYLAWRTHDHGPALTWWREALSENWVN